MQTPSTEPAPDNGAKEEEIPKVLYKVQDGVVHFKISNQKFVCYPENERTTPLACK